MRKEMLKKIMEQKIYDTKNYRYRVAEHNWGELVIERLPLNWLDTTAAYSDWEVVATL